MTIEKKLLGTTPVSGEVLPEAVSFDGSSDYLSRTSDLTNNIDSKTFTFSAWVYNAGGAYIYTVDTGTSNNGYNVQVQYNSSGNLSFRGKNAAYTTVFEFYVPSVLPKNTFSHILISTDLTNSSNRKIYINDIDVTSSATFTAFTNDTIGFTNSYHSVQARFGGMNKYTGRLAHLFLDYTYRDLSIEANRRLFIDADGKPSSTIPSSPILYLPMTDAATAGSNSGTGGDFTVNGVLATAERGPNQDNCSASTFDGSNDYLSRSSITGLSDSKLFTFSFNASQTSGNAQIFTASNGQVSIKLESRQCTVYLGNSGGAVLYFSSPATVASKLYYGQHNHWCFSCDLSDTSKRHMFLNGVDITSGINFIAYVNADADLTHTPNAIGAGATGGDKFTGSIGEFYLDTAYYDLATENPFWDSDTNLPKSVRKVIADTSVTPAIAMPLMGNDAGNNLGSGADFTVNSGPYAGARGGSEFWARSVEGTGSSGISLTRSALSGGASSPNLTVVFSVYLDSINSQKGWFAGGGSGFLAYNDSGGNVFMGSVLTVISASSPFSTGSWHTVLFSMVSNGTSSQRHIYIDGVSAANQTWVTRTTFDLTAGTSGILSDKNGNQNLDGKIAGLFIEQVYTDFSQESNRNKFIDQLGYMKDLSEEGSPLIYMKFDPSSLGTNSGSGGNFTVNGTVTAGSDVTP